MVCVIVTGDPGGVFYPVSDCFKSVSFLPISSEANIISHNFSVLNSFFPLDKMFVVCTIDQYYIVLRSLPGVKEENVIVEPERINFSVTMFYASTVLKRLIYNDPVMFFKSDKLFKKDARITEWLEVASLHSDRDNIVHFVAPLGKDEVSNEFIEAGKISVNERNYDLFTIDRINLTDYEIKKRKIFGKHGKILYIASGKPELFKRRLNKGDNSFIKSLDELLLCESVPWNKIVELYKLSGRSAVSVDFYDGAESDCVMFIESVSDVIRNWDDFKTLYNINSENANFTVGKVELNGAKRCIVINRDSDPVILTDAEDLIVYKSPGSILVKGHKTY